MTIYLAVQYTGYLVYGLVNNPAPARYGERVYAPVPTRLEATRRLYPARLPSRALLGDPLYPTWC